MKKRVLDTVGLIELWVKLLNVLNVLKLEAGLNGQTKVEIIKEKLVIGYNFVRSVIVNMIKNHGVMQQNYGN